MNQIAIDFIKERESCRLVAYADSGGVQTIGWGATGPEIYSGTVWTQQQADDRLAADVGKVESSVSVLVASVRLGQHQMAALISFAYNVGVGALSGSHLLQFVLEKNWIEAAKAFIQWDHVGKMEVKGLLKRRLLEAALFLED
jgi:lysozyme